MNNSYWTRNVDFGLAPLNQLFQWMTKHIIKMKIKPHGTCFPGFREISFWESHWFTGFCCKQMDTKINVIAIMFSTGLQLKKAHEHARRLFSHLRKLSEGKFRLASWLKLSMMMRWTIHYKSDNLWPPYGNTSKNGYLWHFCALNKTNCRMMYVSMHSEEETTLERTHSWPHGY